MGLYPCPGGRWNFHGSYVQIAGVAGRTKAKVKMTCQEDYLYSIITYTPCDKNCPPIEKEIRKVVEVEAEIITWSFGVILTAEVGYIAGVFSGAYSNDELVKGTQGFNIQVGVSGVFGGD